MLADDIRQQVGRLIPALGVSRQADLVHRAFEALCGESLAIDADARSPDRSRINADGTPFQVALDVRRGRPASLQFLGEAGRPSADAGSRRAASEAAWRTLVDVCGAGDEADHVAAVVRALTPEPGTPDTPPSLYWFAVRVPPDGAPSITVYVNAAWGREGDRWRRCDGLAAAFGAASPWQAMSIREPGLAPLGAAVTVTRGQPPRARLYLRGFGLGADACGAWAAEASLCPAAKDVVAQCLDGLRDDPRRRPVPSVVLSIDLVDDARSAGAKVELCGHCLFDDDGAAARRVARWLEHADFDSAAYRAVVEALTEGRAVPPRLGRASLHAFIGAGVRAGEPFASLYLNPGAAIGRPVPA